MAAAQQQTQAPATAPTSTPRVGLQAAASVPPVPTALIAMSAVAVHSDTPPALTRSALYTSSLQLIAFIAEKPLGRIPLSTFAPRDVVALSEQPAYAPNQPQPVLAASAIATAPLSQPSCPPSSAPPADASPLRDHAPPHITASRCTADRLPHSAGHAERTSSRAVRARCARSTHVHLCSSGQPCSAAHRRSRARARATLPVAAPFAAAEPPIPSRRHHHGHRLRTAVPACKRTSLAGFPAGHARSSAPAGSSQVSLRGVGQAAPRSPSTAQTPTRLRQRAATRLQCADKPATSRADSSRNGPGLDRRTQLWRQRSRRPRGPDRGRQRGGRGHALAPADA